MLGRFAQRSLLADCRQEFKLTTFQHEFEHPNHQTISLPKARTYGVVDDDHTVEKGADCVETADVQS